MEQALEQAWAPAVGSGRRWRGEMFRIQDTKPCSPSERQRPNGCKVSQSRDVWRELSSAERVVDAVSATMKRN